MVGTPTLRPEEPKDEFLKPPDCSLAAILIVGVSDPKNSK